MELSRIDHVVLYAEDIHALSEFYADVLDAPVYEYGPGWKTVRLEDCQINFRPVDSEPEYVARPTAGSGDFCLVTGTPIDDVVDHLEADGVEIAIGPVEREGAQGTMTSVYFEDPEGNLAEIANYDV